MKRWLKISLITFGILAVLLYAALWILPLVFNPMDSQDKVAKTFAAKGIEPQHVYYEGAGKAMHYVQVCNACTTTIIFVHGSPGSWNMFAENFMMDTALLNRACIISVDRPGFGESTPKEAEASLEKQAAAIAPILNSAKAKGKVIIVGHSYGGPVVARLAMDYPDWVDALVIVAGSISPAEEEHRWYNRLAAFWPIKIALPKMMQNSNKEIWHLKPELEKMISLWKNINIPVVVIQGDDDPLVPAANADFAEKMLVNADPLFIKRYPDTDHFIPFEQPEMMTSELLMLMDLLAKRPE